MWCVWCVIGRGCTRCVSARYSFRQRINHPTQSQRSCMSQAHSQAHSKAKQSRGVMASKRGVRLKKQKAKERRQSTKKKKKKKEKPKTLTQQKKEKQKPVKSADAWEGSTVIPEGRRCGLGVVARARRYSEQVPRDRIPTSPKWRPSPNECRTKQPTLNVFAVFQDQKTSSSKQHKLSFVETNRPEKGGASFT